MDGDSCRGSRDLAGRRAVVTGAADGVGKAVVRGLLRAGVHVTVVDRDAGRLAGAFGGACRRVAGTLEAQGDGRLLARRVLDRRAGPVELIVHHEIRTGRGILDLDEHDFDEAFNPIEPYLFVKELVDALPAAVGVGDGLVPTKARVVFVGQASTDPFGLDISYQRAKYACETLMGLVVRQSRTDQPMAGVRANLVDPGWSGWEAGASPRSEPWRWHGAGGACEHDGIAHHTLRLLSDACTGRVSGVRIELQPRDALRPSA